MAALTGADLAVDAAFAIHAVPGSYTAPDGEPQAVDLVVNGADAVADLLQGAVRASRYALVRVSELVTPEEGAAITVAEGPHSGSYRAGAPVPQRNGWCWIIPLNAPDEDGEV